MSASEMIRTQKAIMRKKMQEKLKSFLSCGNAVSASETICRKFLDSDAYKNSRTVLLYMSLPAEPDVSSVIRQALSDGKKVCVPKTFLDTNRMDFFYLDDTKELSAQLEYGAFHIREPKPFLEKVPDGDRFPDKSVMLVPGLAFSEDGKRLGRGKGFYDRYIALIPENASVTLCGLCFSFQISADIPVETHDRRLDMVLTD